MIRHSVIFALKNCRERREGFCNSKEVMKVGTGGINVKKI